ncbi:MAG: SDR family oxidoreductase [Bacteroidota bacterium]|jgi:NAD(P)-dependent dehydrogenase (short-subunit alcohol dehydrogenase family)
MNLQELTKAYDFIGKTIAITGGGGVLCGEMARCLAGCNANVVILDRDMSLGEKVIQSLKGTKGKHRAVFIDVLDKAKVQEAASVTLAEYGKVDILINGAGGNNPKATTNAEMSFFDIPTEAIQFVSNLNLIGTILPSQIFGKQMVAQKEGIILNVSSMNAFRPLTRIPAYSAAKAAISNFTQWLAVHMAQEYTPNIRVNAIAPGFFLTEQNRFLLTDKATGELTARGKKILDHTPAGRFGTPDDLLGAMLWLLSPASKFVTGIVLPIDGGFSAYSGV